MCGVIAVVSVAGVVCTKRMAVRTDLVRRTVECHVHTKATIHIHYTARHNVPLPETARKYNKLEIELISHVSFPVGAVL